MPGKSNNETAPAILATQLARISNGDRVAMRELYVATSARLFGVVLRILTDRSESEDVLQDVYLTVWRHADRYNVESASPMPWLIAMTRNRAIDRLRRRGKVQSDGGESAVRLVDPEPCAFTQFAKKQQSAHLQDYLGRMEPRAATALRMAFFDGDTYVVVAQRLGISEGTAKSIIRRKLLDLRFEIAR